MIRPPVRNATRTAMLAGAALVLAGCSQVAALAPVSGNRITEVRFAANDVLLDRGIALAVAPVCDQDGPAITCAGTTAAGEPIAVSASGPAATADTLTVSVNGTTIYQGSVRDVLDASARSTS